MSRVALIGENSAEFVDKLLDIWNNGDCAVLLDWRIPLQTAIQMMREAEVTACFIEKKLLDKYAVDDISDITFIAYEVADISPKLLSDEVRKKYRENYSKDEAVVIYSSGTTGKSKGIILSHFAITTNADAIIDYMQPSTNDCLYTIRPLSHSSTVTGELLVALKSGCKYLLAPTIVPPRYIFGNISKFDVTILCLNPTVLSMLTDEYSRGKISVIPLKTMYVSGSVLNDDTYSKAHDTFSGVNIYNVYGLSEASPRVTAQRADCCKSNSVGKAIKDVEVVVVDENGNMLPTRNRGIIHVNTPCRYSGYICGEEKHPSLYNGWLNTGDVGYFDDNGELHIINRIDDVIIMNGHKIYPSEVAEQIHKSAEIDECVVMLNFDLIKKSIEYTSNLFKTKRVIYSITCNGSILSNEHIEFFEKNNVDLLISLDGPKEIQNKNRKFAANGYGTYDVVSMNVKNIISKHNNYFKEHVRFNPVILNKDDQIDVYNYFTNNLNLPTEKFSPSIANLSGTDYFTHITVKEETKNLFRNRSLETTQNSLKENNSIGSIYCHGGPCIPGFSKLMVSTDGDFYPCEKVNEKNNVYKIGNILSGFNKTRLIGFFDMVKLSEEQCKKCWQIRLCHICPMECGVVEGNGYSFEQKRIKCDAQSNLLISHFKKIVLNKGGKECRDI